MANEVNDGSDKVERLSRGDRTSENTSKDSIIGGDRKDHQQIHQDASKAGQTFETFSDNDDDQSFKAIQPAADSFGIDFGDGTIETAKGIVSKPTPQDAFEQKGQEVLAAAQRLKPPSPDSISLGGHNYKPDQLIAANVTNNPIRSDATLPNPDEAKETGLPDDTVAQYQKTRDWHLQRDIVRATDLSAATHPFRGREASEVNKISAVRWNEAYNLFPELAEAGISNGSVTEVSKAIVRNELHHYDMWDRADDTAARVAGHPLPLRKNEGDATLGFSQLSPNSITKRCDEFPRLREYLTMHHYPPGAELKALADPEMAPVLVAANLAHNAKMYARHSIPVNERTLAYGFNPDEKDSKGAKILLPDESTLNKSQHVANVMLQLDLLRKGQ